MNLLRRQSVRRQTAVLVVPLLLPLTTGAVLSGVESRHARIEERWYTSASLATAGASFEPWLRGTTIDVPGRSAPAAWPRPRQRMNVNAVERFVASAEVGRGSWTMTGSVPTPMIAMRMADGRRTLVVLIAAALFAWVALVFRMSRQLSRQLNYLSKTARSAAHGDPLPVPLARPMTAELAQLQLAIVTEADALRQTRAELEQLVEQERKVRDMLETLQRHTVRQERLAAVGLLLSGVAHELNNPLQAIMGAAELLERRDDLPADAQEEVALVGTQVQRAAEIIRHLSRFGTQRPSLPTAIDVQDVVSEVVQLRRTDLEAARIACQVHTVSTGKVFASFTEIEQVVLNFVINAQQSIQTAGITGGLIVIRSFDLENRVRLEVIDNGPGVAIDDESNLFQPFFTTKPVGEGTGLGLSVSHGIIESFGGTIGHRPGESGGAVFYFELPRV